MKTSTHALRRPPLTVVIPTIGRMKRLRATLGDLARQELEGWECLVVAQDEDTVKAMAGDARVGQGRLEVILCRRPSASAARNAGLLRAQADLVLFLDDDVRIEDPRFLRRHLVNYADPGVCGVVGQVLGTDRKVRETRDRRSRRPRVGWLYFPYNYSGRCRIEGGLTGNLSVRRACALAVGGMDERYDRGAHREDSDFCLRLVERCGPLAFDPSASLVHVREPRGGCRLWGSNRGIHPLHHLVGEWYFILKNLRAHRLWVRDLPDHLFCLARRQIFNNENLRSPWRLPIALLMSGRALFIALGRVVGGPLYVVADHPPHPIRDHRGLHGDRAPAALK